MASQPTAALYPLLTQPRRVHPIWGGHQLAGWLGLPEGTPERLGETWQVYDTNPIVNGSLAGHTLAEATRQFGAALIGQRSLDRYGADFPLLAKFIDAADRLSIQVHPDDHYAHRREADTGFHGKTEAWYILSAAPGASVVYGFRQNTSREEVAGAIANGTVEGLLQRMPVQAGEVIYVPAGTVHAIEAGIVLFEIQQKSDLTYRVYDYDRRDAVTGLPRTLHLEKALDVLDYAPAGRAAVPPLPLAEGRDLLVACPYFALERWALTTEQALTTDPGTFEIFTVIEGSAGLRWAGGKVPLPRGASVVVPAVLGPYGLLPEDSTEPASLLRVYVPDLEHDLLAPLRAAGANPERLAQTIAG